jgi:hypothetical protein
VAWLGSGATAAAFGLRDERLHRQADAADQHEKQQDEPVDGGHAGHRRSRDVADEPRVGQADDGLQAAVGHQRQGERGDHPGNRRECTAPVTGS